MRTDVFHPEMGATGEWEPFGGDWQPPSPANQFQQAVAMDARTNRIWVGSGNKIQVLDCNTKQWATIATNDPLTKSWAGRDQPIH